MAAMPRLAVAVAVWSAVLAAAAPAGAERGAAPRLTATPARVAFGTPVSVRGSGWPVIEFCRRRVRLSLDSDQNAFVLGFARIRVTGRFAFTWTPRRSRVGAGAGRLVARQRCESGKDGSTVFVRRSVPLRIR
jgi:hypothetical protein